MATKKTYCYVTATNEYSSLARYGTVKIAVACTGSGQATQVEKRMEKKGYYKHISRAKNKPYYDKKHYVTRYLTASAFLKQ